MFSEFLRCGLGMPLKIASPDKKQLRIHDSPSSVSSLFQSTSLRTAIDPTVLTCVLINDHLKHLKCTCPIYDCANDDPDSVLFLSKCQDFLAYVI